MATLVVIPARLAATRLRRKPLRLLAGEPIIVRVWQRVMAMKIADACVVATDHSEVQHACESAGADAVMTSSSHPSGTDRVAEVADLARFREFDTIVNVQGDEPFVSEAAIRGALALVSPPGRRFPIATAAVDGSEADLVAPDVVKVVTASDNKALYFSRAPIPWLRSAEDSAKRTALIRRHIGVYVYAREALKVWVALPEHPLENVERLEQLRPLAAGMSIGVARVNEKTFRGIDTEDDLVFANEHWEAFTSGQR